MTNKISTGDAAKQACLQQALFGKQIIVISTIAGYPL